MRPVVVALLLALVAPAEAGWPLGGRSNRVRQEDLDNDESQREQLNRYERAFAIQHSKLLELRIRNRELERACTNLLNVLIFSIIWPRVSSFISARAAARSHGPVRPTTFADVAGSVEAKRELQEVVEFLKNPKKFTQVGARVPKGVLMEGGPGLGKTMLARAVAGEAGVRFIDTTGSELGSNIYVGVGASKVRALFAEARKKGPCIIFIDEIDAIGGKRADSSNSGGRESARTLNQLLTEMDGFKSDTGVVVIAATNRADVLDPALLRAGRFDRRVPIGAPDVEERTAILKVHAKGKQLASDLDLSAVAKRTSGFSGAELATLLNEAAIGTASRNATLVCLADVDLALDKMQIGLRRPSHVAARVRETIAVHEAGHAAMALLTGFDRVSKVTILPRSNGVGGFTAFANAGAEEVGGLPSRSRLLQELQVLFGGRVAEELALGKAHVTVGAQGDLSRAHELALAMVTRYGMAKDGSDLGLTLSERYVQSSVPESVSKRVSHRVDDLLRDSYTRCRRTMRANWRFVYRLKQALLEKETLTALEVDQLFAAHQTSSATHIWRALCSVMRLPATLKLPESPLPATAPV